MLMSVKECLRHLKQTTATLLHHEMKYGFFHAEMVDQDWHTYVVYQPQDAVFSCRFYPPDEGENPAWGPARVFLSVKTWEEGESYARAFESLQKDYQADLL
jgi:hypothetical protein